MSKAIKNYIARVEKELETSSTEMSRTDYIEALEEIQSVVECRLDAARQEQEIHDEPPGGWQGG